MATTTTPILWHRMGNGLEVYYARNQSQLRVGPKLVSDTSRVMFHGVVILVREYNTSVNMKL